MRTEDLFRTQILQDTISAYYSVPIRVIKRNAFNLVFKILEGSGFFKKYDISSEEIFKKFLIDFFEVLPDFYQENCKPSQEFIGIVSLFAKEDIEVIKEISRNIFYTHGSYHPKMYRKLKTNQMFFSYTLLLALCVIVKIEFEEKKECSISRSFSFRAFGFNGNTAIVGPFCGQDGIKTFIKNVIHYFPFKLHFFEFDILYEDIDRKNSSETYYEIRQIFQEYIPNILDLDTGKYILSQENIKTIASFLVCLAQLGKNEIFKYIKINEEYKLGCLCPKFSFERRSQYLCASNSMADLSEIKKQIQTHQYIYQLEAFNSIGDNLYEKLIISNEDRDKRTKFELTIVKTLKRLVHADIVLFYNYIEHTEEFKLLGTDGLKDDESKIIEEMLRKINNEDKGKSAAHRITRNYYNDEEEIGLYINNIEKDQIIQPPLGEDKLFKSILSIPLIYDHKIRGLVHFISYRENAFDDENKKFLLQFSGFLTHLMVESIFLERQSEIIEKITEVDYEAGNQKKELTEICSIVSDIFAADGAMIFLHSRDIRDTPAKYMSLQLVANIGFDPKLDSSIQPLTLRIDGSDSLLGSDSDIIVSKNIYEDIDKKKMKYFDLFAANKINSFMAIKIDNVKNFL